MTELVQTGIHFRDFPAAAREAARLSVEEKARLVESWRTEGLAEGAVFIQTCNRECIYVSSTNPMAVSDRIASMWTSRLAARLEMTPEEIERRIHRRFGTSVARHLMRVTGALDSMLVGESQILGQVKSALAESECKGWMSSELSRLFTHAIKTAKTIRTRTSIGRGALGLDAVALECLCHAGLAAGDPVAVVGTGKLGANVVRSLLSRGMTNVACYNRSGALPEKLQSLGNVPIKTADQLPAELSRFRAVVLVATVDEPLLKCDMLDASRTQPLVVVDLGLPANAEHAMRNHPGARLYNLDDLRHISAERFRQREEALGEATRIVEEGLSRFLHETRLRLVGDLVGEMSRRLHDFRSDLPKKLNGELSQFAPDLQPQVVEAMRHVLGKLEHDVLTDLKRGV